MKDFIEALSSFAANPNAKKAQEIIKKSQKLDADSLNQEKLELVKEVASNCRFIKPLIAQREDLKGAIQATYEKVVEALQTEVPSSPVIEELKTLQILIEAPPEVLEEDRKEEKEVQEEAEKEELEEDELIDLFKDDDLEDETELIDDIEETEIKLKVGVSEEIDSFIESISDVVSALGKTIRADLKNLKSACELAAPTASDLAINEIKKARKSIEHLETINRLLNSALSTADFSALASYLEEIKEKEKDILVCPYQTVFLFGWKGDNYALPPEEVIKTLKVISSERHLVEKSAGFYPRDFPALVEALYTAFREKVPNMSKAEFANMFFPLIEKPEEISKVSKEIQPPEFLILVYSLGKSGVILADYFKRVQTSSYDWTPRNDQIIKGEITSAQGVIYPLISIESLVRKIEKRPVRTPSIQKNNLVDRLKASIEELIERIR